MRVDILLSMLFDLLNERKITAKQFSERYGLSPRSVYRYVGRLAPFLPLQIRQGRGGGVFLEEGYKLPVAFLSEEEYESVQNALSLAYAIQPKEALLSAKRKLFESEREGAGLR